MLKTVYKFLELMKAQRRKLYLSFLFNFLDGIFIMIPLVIAYYMVASIPELNKNATKQMQSTKESRIVVPPPSCREALPTHVRSVAWASGPA